MYPSYRFRALQARRRSGRWYASMLDGISMGFRQLASIHLYHQATTQAVDRQELGSSHASHNGPSESAHPKNVGARSTNRDNDNLRPPCQYLFAPTIQRPL